MIFHDLDKRDIFKENVQNSMVCGSEIVDNYF